MGPSLPTESLSPQSEAGLTRRWHAIHAAGQEIGAMAGLAAEPLAGALKDFPSQIETRGGAYLALARDAIDDLDAILQPGLAALHTIKSRGQDTTAPALALWREFHALRQAVLRLAGEINAADTQAAA